MLKRSPLVIVLLCAVAPHCLHAQSLPSPSLKSLTLPMADQGSSGNISGMSVKPAAGTVARALGTRANDSLNAKDFGAVGAGGDDTTPIQTMFGALSDGGQLRFLQGLYAGTASQAVTGKSLFLRGEGSRLTRFQKLGAGDGISVVLNGGRQSADMRGVTLETTGYNSGTAISVNYGLTGFENRENTRLLWDDVEIRGTDVKTNGWSRLAHLSNINGATFSKLQLNGISTQGTAGGNEATQTITPMGLEWDGVQYPTDAVFSQTRAYQLGTAFKFAGATEGINFDQFTTVSVGTMVAWTPDSGYAGRPHFSLTNGHANVFKTIAQLDGVQQIGIYNVQGYHQQGPSSNGVLYQINNGIDAELGGNGLFKYSGTGVTTTGMAFSGNASANINVSRNHFGGAYTTLDTGITIAAGTTGVVIANDNFWNTTTDIVDNTGGLVQYGTRRDVYSLGSTASIPNNVDTTIPFNVTGERFLGLTLNGDGSFTVPAGKGIRRITGTIEATWGAETGGRRQIQITKDGESAPYMRDSRAAGGSDGVTATTITIPVLPGDKLRVNAYQNSGAATSLTGAGFTRIVWKMD